MWPAIAIGLGVIVGGLAVLLIRRDWMRRAELRDINKDVELKTSGWIARELQRHSTQKDDEAFNDFEDFFGGGESK
jgi:hypothetical protein